MGIDLALYRAAIGQFSAKSLCFHRINICSLSVYLFLLFLLLNFSCCLTWYAFFGPRRSKFRPSSMNSIFLSWLLFFSLINRILLILGGVELNPGPPPTSKFYFATFNVDSLLARDGCKLSAIEGIDRIHKFDLFGIC